MKMEFNEDGSLKIPFINDGSGRVRKKLSGNIYEKKAFISKTSFFVDEADKIKQLLIKKKAEPDCSRKRDLLKKIRRLGFYSSDFIRLCDREFDVIDFDGLIRSKLIKVVERAEIANTNELYVFGDENKVYHFLSGDISKKQIKMMYEAIPDEKKALDIIGAKNKSDRRFDFAVQFLRKKGLIYYSGCHWHRSGSKKD